MAMTKQRASELYGCQVTLVTDSGGFATGTVDNVSKSHIRIATSASSSDSIPFKTARVANDTERKVIEMIVKLQAAIDNGTDLELSDTVNEIFIDELKQLLVLGDTLEVKPEPLPHHLYTVQWKVAVSATSHEDAARIARDRHDCKSAMCHKYRVHLNGGPYPAFHHVNLDDLDEQELSEAESDSGSVRPLREILSTGAMNEAEADVIRSHAANI